MKILIIGGDSRQCEIGRRFADIGHEVYTFALELPLNNAYAAEDLQKALANSDIVLLPLPMTRDGIYINTPFYSGERITLDEVFSGISKNSLLLCGKMSDVLREKAKSLHLHFEDYYENETFLGENAYITAEGAVFLAMERLKTTVKKCPVLIVGGGRIAKNLFLLLSAMNARVCFCARNDYDLRWAEALGAKTLDLASDTEDIERAVEKSDVIFNTVPVRVIPDCAFEKAKKELIYIELAGDEGLISPVLTEKGIYVVCAKALPSKYAPQSAGLLLYDTISDILKEKKGEKA